MSVDAVTLKLAKNHADRLAFGWGGVDEIKAVIPNQADPANQLADKEFVNSSIQNMAARYVAATAAGDAQFASLAALNAGPWFCGGRPYLPTSCDYSIFINSDNSVWRAGFDGSQWNAQYKVNDTPFTAAQLAALNSGITAALAAKISNLNFTAAQQAALDSGITAALAAKINNLNVGWEDLTVTRTWASSGQFNAKLNRGLRLLALHINGVTLQNYAIGDAIATISFPSGYAPSQYARCIIDMDSSNPADRIPVNLDIIQNGGVNIYPQTRGKMAGQGPDGLLYGNAVIYIF